MNMIRYLLYTIAGLGRRVVQAGGDGLQWGQDYFNRTRQLASRSVGITLLPLVIGLIIGRIGYAAGSPALEGVGQGLISFSSIAAAVLLTFLYLRLVILTEALVAATGVAHELNERIPRLAQAEAERFLAFLRNYTVWIMAVGLFGQLVPLYRNLALTGIVLVCFLILAGAMSAGWSNPGKYRKRVVGLTVLVLLFATASLLFPSGMSHLRERVDLKVQQLTSRSEANEAIDKVSLKATKRSDRINAEVLQRLLDEKVRIEERAAKDCNRKFCSKADEERYRQLKKLVADAKEGKYFQRQAKLEDPSLWQRVKKPFVGEKKPAASQPTRSAALPPPPVPPIPYGSAIAPPPPIVRRPPAPQIPNGADGLAPPPPSGYQPPQRSRQASDRPIPTPNAKDDSFKRMLADLNGKYPDLQ
jgi:hypothetical protein